jgi:hypothetical protein
VPWRSRPKARPGITLRGTAVAVAFAAIDLAAARYFSSSMGGKVSTSPSVSNP